VPDGQPPAGGAASPSIRTLILCAAGLSAAITLVFVGLDVAGVVRTWYPLPYLDMWDGYVGFWYKLKAGDTGAWWAQHNEHRIVLARIAFWLDLRFLHGAGWSLIVWNVLAMLGNAVVLLAALRERLRETRSRQPLIVVVLLAGALVAISTSWLQRQNLVWGFQLQFLLASLLPLAAFTALGRAGNLRGTTSRQAAVLLVVGGVASALSVGTIAIGLLVPFVATLLVGLLGFRPRVVAAFALMAVALAVAYLHGYVTPPQSASPLQSLTQHPVATVDYLVTYLGGPAHGIVPSFFVDRVAGALFLAATGFHAVRQLMSRSRQGVGLATAAFAGFVVAGGLLTATGRLTFGIDQALASRYQTPVLMGWACLLVAAAPWVVHRARTTAWAMWVLVGALLAVPVVLLPAQGAALQNRTAAKAHTDLATLAVALGVPDAQALSHVYPRPRLPVRLGRRLIAEHLTVVGQPPYRDLQRRLGTHQTDSRTLGCASQVRVKGPVAHSGYRRLRGWVTHAQALGASRGDILTLLDSTGTVVGFGVAEPLGAKSPFPTSVGALRVTGYVQAGRHATLSVASARGTCSPTPRLPRGATGG
jgi:hypothetical protein